MKKLPIASIGLGLATVLCSMIVAYIVTGSFLGKVTMIQLKSFGGITVSHMANWEVWRLLSSQLVHAKQYHMFYNVLSLIVLGYAIEKRIGWLMFFLVWFLAGTSGTLYSTLFVPEPWNTGTGGSQAILGLAGFGIVLTTTIKSSRNLIYALVFVLLPAFSLDLIFSNYPKPGHILGLAVGMLIGVLYVNKLTKSSSKDAASGAA
ncbi:MAG: rhomboid family intramembrane serine protease [Marinomonas sp.]